MQKFLEHQRMFYRRTFHAQVPFPSNQFLSQWQWRIPKKQYPPPVTQIKKESVQNHASTLPLPYKSDDILIKQESSDEDVLVIGLTTEEAMEFAGMEQLRGMDLKEVLKLKPFLY